MTLSRIVFYLVGFIVGFTVGFSIAKDAYQLEPIPVSEKNTSDVVQGCENFHKWAHVNNFPHGPCNIRNP